MGDIRKGIRDWFTLGDYDAEKAGAMRKIFARFSRGNAAAQNGDYLSEEDTADLARRGDRAMADLARTIARR